MRVEFGLALNEKRHDPAAAWATEKRLAGGIRPHRGRGIRRAGDGRHANMALMDARTRGVQSPGRYRWWLDLETANSWQSSTRNNRADLEAMAFYFRHIGAKVGIYDAAQPKLIMRSRLADAMKLDFQRV